MKTITVTQLEKKVLEALANEMYAECGFSDAGLREVIKGSGLSVNVVRGVMSSLIKKDLIYVWDREGDWGINHKDVYMHIWYLTEQTKGLVTEWVGEDEVEAVELVVE
jgi:hypothetical protein